MSKIEKFTLGKGRTTKSGEDYARRYLEMTVKLSEQHTDEDFQAALDMAEYLIDEWLGESKPPQVPEFNPDELMKHEGWKARKKDDGSYAEGSLSWGWDFADKFSKEILQILEKGPLTIDKYEFNLNKERTLVSAKKKENRKGR